MARTPRCILRTKTNFRSRSIRRSSNSTVDADRNHSSFSASVAVIRFVGSRSVHFEAFSFCIFHQNIFQKEIFRKTDFREMAVTQPLRSWHLMATYRGIEGLNPLLYR